MTRCLLLWSGWSEDERLLPNYAQSSLQSSECELGPHIMRPARGFQVAEASELSAL
jgi:hypothetical protein